MVKIVAESNVAEKDVAGDSTASAPKWLNESFLGGHLRNHYKNDAVKVINFEAKAATGKGENFASCLYRVNVSYSIASKNGSQADNDVS